MTRIAIIDITSTGSTVETDEGTAIEVTYSSPEAEATTAWVLTDELHCARRDGLDSIEAVEV